jgi:5-methyltetrahydropteroyltriglutamate--homocysteine methyltransferase
MVSVQRILTTHTGSLPRPDDLARMIFARDDGEAVEGIDERVREAVRDVVGVQVETGIDLVNDGEQGKIGYSTYVKDRLTGFEGEAERPSSRRPEMEEHPDFAARFGAQISSARLRVPACTGDIRVKDAGAARRDVENLKAAAAAKGVDPGRLFMTAASPGVVSHFFANHHYPSREAFLGAIADAMRDEYRTIVESGIALQVDCPDLAMSRHSMFADRSVEEFRREAALSVEALNHALAGLPQERLRMHVCWGNYEGPHTHDVELRDIIDIVLTARPAGVSVEASNPRHGHEWRVFEEVRLPEGKYLIPGVIDSTNNYVEHPDLVAQRLLRYASVVGADRVVGGSDCGFGTFAGMATVAPSITWAKFRSLAEGARRASAEFAME